MTHIGILISAVIGAFSGYLVALIVLWFEDYLHQRAKRNVQFEGKRTHASSNVYNSDQSDVKFEGIRIQYLLWNKPENFLKNKSKIYEEVVWTGFSILDINNFTEEQMIDLDDNILDLIYDYTKKNKGTL